ncbi:MULTISPECIES: hypothetical protein [unclassified Pseudomonas]|uniref:hypothetical protein n=1 Tax=unclassified Pseudomonas TaxID=196821 RepID=UPI001A9EEC43|nr:MULTISPECIES: hypothetical protein [unclassified Pseudomonas]
MSMKIASQADNEGSITFTRSTIFKASSGIEVASGETGDSYGDSHTICVVAPVSIPPLAMPPFSVDPWEKGNFGNVIFDRPESSMKSSS